MYHSKRPSVAPPAKNNDKYEATKLALQKQNYMAASASTASSHQAYSQPQNFRDQQYDSMAAGSAPTPSFPSSSTAYVAKSVAANHAAKYYADRQERAAVTASNNFAVKSHYDLPAQPSHHSHALSAYHNASRISPTTHHDNSSAALAEQARIAAYEREKKEYEHASVVAAQKAAENARQYQLRAERRNQKATNSAGVSQYAEYMQSMDATYEKAAKAEQQRQAAATLAHAQYQHHQAAAQHAHAIALSQQMAMYANMDKPKNALKKKNRSKNNPTNSQTTASFFDRPLTNSRPMNAAYAAIHANAAVNPNTDMNTIVDHNGNFVTGSRDLMLGSHNISTSNYRKVPSPTNSAGFGTHKNRTMNAMSFTSSTTSMNKFRTMSNADSYKSGQNDDGLDRSTSNLNNNKKKKDPAAKAQKNFQRLLAKQQKTNTYSVVEFFAENKPQPQLEIRVPEKDEFLEALLEPPTPLNSHERPRAQLSMFFDVKGMFVAEKDSPRAGCIVNGSPTNAHKRSNKSLRKDDDLLPEERENNALTSKKWARVRDYLEDVSDSNNSTVRECFERLRKFAITDEEKEQILKEAESDNVPTLILNVDLSDAYKRMALCVKMLHALCGKEPRILATFRMRPPPISAENSSCSEDEKVSSSGSVDLMTTAAYVDGFEHLPMKVRDAKRLERDDEYDLEGNRIIDEETRDTAFYESLAEMLELETPGFFSLPGDPEEKRRLKEERAQLRRELKHKQNLAKRAENGVVSATTKDSSKMTNSLTLNISDIMENVNFRDMTIFGRESEEADFDKKSISPASQNSGVLVDLLKNASKSRSNTNSPNSASSSNKNVNNIIFSDDNKSIEQKRFSEKNFENSAAKTANYAAFPERAFGGDNKDRSQYYLAVKDNNTAFGTNSQNLPTSQSSSSCAPPPGLGFSTENLSNSEDEGDRAKLFAGEYEEIMKLHMAQMGSN